MNNILVETFMPSLVSLTCPSLQISDLRISGQSLIKENNHNSRAGVDIDMKPQPKQHNLKKIDDNVIAFFLIYGQFGAI